MAGLFPSEGDFYSSESEVDSPSLTLDTNQRSPPSTKTTEMLSPCVARAYPTVSQDFTKVTPCEIDDDEVLISDTSDSSNDSSKDFSDLSSDSKKFIEPDVSSINKLLNFDSGEESCEDILDDVGNDTDKLLMFDDPVEDTDDDFIYEPNKEQMHHSLKEELRSSWSGVSSRLAMANLSLEEVGHIRSVHAKADIEGLPDEGSTKKNVKQGKICFQCVKTKFGLFCRSIKCPLCCQAVCSKCVAKISATPSISLPLADTSTVVGSTSTTLPRLRSATTSTSRCVASSDKHRLSRTGSLRRGVWSLPSTSQGSLLTVCLDCKEMVVNIIRSGETAKKMDAARSMMLASLGRREIKSKGHV